MKSWRILRHGGPEVLVYEEMPELVAGPGQAVIEVEAVGLNHLDLWVAKGVPGHTFHLPITPGGDIAGKIKALGPGAESQLDGSSLKVGSPVILNPGLSCGHCQACLSGNDPLCPKYGILGETVDGGCADQIRVPVTNLIARPPQISAVQGAALSIAYLTAFTMLVKKAKLVAGETILIQASGSGVSVASIQIAKLLGATVITTASSETKATKALALGADHIIHTYSGTFKDQMKDILKKLGKKGCEVVMDHVGVSTFKDSLKSLAWGGRLVTCGATSGSEVTIDLKALFFKNISIFGNTMGSKGDLIQIIDLVAQGKLKAIIDQTLPMAELPLAFKLIETRAVFGKIVLKNNTNK